MNINYLIKNNILLILPAKDFNEHEYLIISKALIGAGKKIYIVSDSNFLCVGMDRLRIVKDIHFYNIHETNFSSVIFIGGTGTRKYLDNKLLYSVTQNFNNKKKLIEAIYSAPVILVKACVIEKAGTF
ncbi:MAG: DJ-1/PfpI family protein [Melioribacter sp.]|nr:DJ-1/PfpI family protein [Melioribacter sp.]